MMKALAINNEDRESTTTVPQQSTTQKGTQAHKHIRLS